MVRFLGILSLGWLSQEAWSIPMQVTVNQRSSECLYDKLDEGYVAILTLVVFELVLRLICVSSFLSICREKVTMSVFILSGPSLKATAMLQGPVSPPDVNTGKELFDDAEKWESNKDGTDINFEHVLDFEHLKSQLSESDEDDDEEINTPVVKEKPLDPNDPEATEKRRKRREKQREVFLATKAKRDQKRLLQQKKIRKDGAPFMHTVTAPAAGWYRVCVHGTFYQVSRHYLFI
jgi:hypothetical protein